MTNIGSSLLKIRPRLLLAYYACIPLAGLVVLVDLLLGGELKRSMPANPDDYALFTLLFTLPHIISSFFGFIEKEYVRTYGPKLLKGARYTVFTAILVPLVSLQLAFAIFAILTMYHVFRQQSGIAKSLMRGANRYHAYWEWLGIVLSLGLYVDIYTALQIPQEFGYVWVLGAIVYTLYAVKSVVASKTSVGKHYFWATHAIPLASAALLLLGYPILAIAIPRIIHDLTAYTFYITHDRNRFHDTHGNYLYRTFARARLPVALVNPLISVVFALAFQLNIFGGTYLTLTILFLFHYYTESFIWKSDSPHRQYIAYTS